MSRRDEGKGKVLKIDLTYHRQRSWLGVARWIAAAGALCVAALYAAWIVWIDRPSSGSSWRVSHLSTGPLAKVHASFENDCVRCHGDNFGIGLSADVFQLDHEPRLSNQEQKCQECHHVDGHSRDMLKNVNADRDCSRCHHDHQGRDKHLSEIANKICTDCHASLTTACRAGVSSTLSPSISAFNVQSHAVVEPTGGTKESPAPSKTFRSLAQDTGRVRFDHAQHMRAGQIDEGSRGGFQLGMLPPELQNRYNKSGQELSSLVQLQCADCHQPMALRPSTLRAASSSTAIDGDEGRFFAPVSFDAHCAACHQMTFAGQKSENLPLPHVATRAEYTRLLRTAQTIGLLDGRLSMAADGALKDDYDSLPLGELMSDRNRPLELNHARISAGVDGVMKRCEQCHDPRDTQPAVIERALAGTLEPLIPERWLKFGSFDHAAHATIERCELCHKMPTTTGPASDHTRVLIEGPASCVGCHRDVTTPEPAEFRTASQRQQTLGPKPQPTWASAECTTCHRYHWTRPVDPPPIPSKPLDEGVVLSSPGGILAP